MICFASFERRDIYQTEKNQDIRPEAGYDKKTEK